MPVTTLVATVASLTAGRWYDRTGPRAVFATAAAVYVLAYGLFAAGGHNAIVVALGFAAAGAGIGLAEPTQSTVVAQLLPDRLRGSGFGVLGAVQATGDVVATVVAGLLYTVASPDGGVRLRRGVDGGRGGRLWNAACITALAPRRLMERNVTSRSSV